MKIYRMYELLDQYDNLRGGQCCDALNDFCMKINQEHGAYPWSKSIKDADLRPALLDYWIGVLYCENKDYDYKTGESVREKLFDCSYEFISDHCALIAEGWTSFVNRDYMLSDRDMMFFAIGAMQMSTNPADVAFWGLVHDSCSFD